MQLPEDESGDHSIARSLFFRTHKVQKKDRRFLVDKNYPTRYPWYMELTEAMVAVRRLLNGADVEDAAAKEAMNLLIDCAQRSIDSSEAGYVLAGTSFESRSESGVQGVKIMVAAGRPLSKDESYAISDKAEEVFKIIAEKSIRLDPEKMAAAQQERQDLLNLFKSPIFVEEIPNVYCSDYCCKHKPWFIVTTTRGRIKIGWRKLVIEIDWTDSAIKATAAELFPVENVTKQGRMIHAWRYEHAERYIATLTESK